MKVWCIVECRVSLSELTVQGRVTKRAKRSEIAQNNHCKRKALNSGCRQRSSKEAAATKNQIKKKKQQQKPLQICII
jgi:hypothetical protein